MDRSFEARSCAGLGVLRASLTSALVLAVACGAGPAGPDVGTGNGSPSAGDPSGGGTSPGSNGTGGASSGSTTPTPAPTETGSPSAPPPPSMSMPPGVAVISDVFAGPNNQTIDGMKPDTTNLPGGAWSMDAVNTSGAFEAFIDTGDGNPAPSLHLYDVGGSTGSAAIPIWSVATYTKPTRFSLSVDIKELNPGIVLYVGFYGTLPASGAASITGLTGLGYHTDSGNLDLIEDGATKTTLPFTGKFESSGFNTLSFSVDTSTGALSNVHLTGNTGSYPFSTAAFTDAATRFIAFGTATGGAQGACQYFDNLLMKSE